MNFITFENYLRSFTFICLFFNLLFYWIKGAFFSIMKNNNFEIFLLLLSNLSLTLFLIIRWIESNHFPLSNLYESLIFLCWSLNLFLLVLEIKINQSYIGIVIAPIILIINTFATFSLPIEMQKASSIVPALKSNWLMMHVTIMMLSYSALIFGSLLAISFLAIKLLITNTKNKSFLSFTYQKEKLNDSLTLNFGSATNLPKIDQVKILDKLDNLSYRILGIGFPLLTIGILSGAVWANETWGSYWSWDPKETWAFITWIIYAIYLHSRIIKGWKGVKPAFIASFGFLIVWICYLGVNLLGKGLHSYGWFNLVEF